MHCMYVRHAGMWYVLYYILCLAHMQSITLHRYSILGHFTKSALTGDITCKNIMLTKSQSNHYKFFLLILGVPRGDGPLPEVGAIPGQPVKETKQALCILLGTKI